MSTMRPLLAWITVRLHAFLVEKLAVTAGLTALWCAWWFVIPRYVVTTTHAFPLTGLEQSVPFVEWSVYVYLSICVFMPAAPFLTRSRAMFARHAWGFLGLTVVAFGCFVLYPVQLPAPDVVPTTHLYRLVAFDTRLNNFPSLHAGYTVYSLLYWEHILGEIPGRLSRRLTAFVVVTWAGLLMLSILLLKQHYLVDVLAGSALGGLFGKGASKGPLDPRRSEHPGEARALLDARRRPYADQPEVTP